MHEKPDIAYIVGSIGYQQDERSASLAVCRGQFVFMMILASLKKDDQAFSLLEYFITIA